ncbi:cell division protein ZapA [Sandaracinobacteroides saxicola]|uniref:Cell division protein ZapA n=1 Tax=Sandaracinobacteroides saxicola TaxID=2759707 RepID=A0A7G5IK71_9SPHN|nr:cell division protein ZapA [Sandaracinobacteroides saxicola]QMW23763.1 cell division protein ZapA [Sandaracinobacteroides saxicola]
MAEVSVSVGGRHYRLTCRDGEEAQIRTAAAHIASKTDALTAGLGPIPEGQLLLMAGLMITDELFSARNGSGAPSTPADDPVLLAAIARLEALADKLEADG